MAQNAFFNALTHYRSCFPFLFSFGKRKTHLFMIQLKFCNISLLSRIGIVYYVPTGFIFPYHIDSGSLNIQYQIRTYSQLYRLISGHPTSSISFTIDSLNSSIITEYPYIRLTKSSHIFLVHFGQYQILICALLRCNTMRQIDGSHLSMCFFRVIHLHHIIP